MHIIKSSKGRGGWRKFGSWYSSFEDKWVSLWVFPTKSTSRRSSLMRWWSHCCFNQVWRCKSCNDDKKIWQKMCCTFRVVFFFFCFFSCFWHHSGSADLASSVTTQNNSIRNNFGKDTTGLTHTETHLWSCFILQLYYTWLYILSSDLYVGEQTETWQTNHKHCRVWLLFPEPAYHHL